jgi:hypothetical protein
LKCLLKLDRPFFWTSSDTKKESVIVGIVPRGLRPADVGFKVNGVCGSSRRHESYIVRGGMPGKKNTNYWPVVSLLQQASTLSSEEIKWCHENTDAVRALMASMAK